MDGAFDRWSGDSVQPPDACKVHELRVVASCEARVASCKLRVARRRRDSARAVVRQVHPHAEAKEQHGVQRLSQVASYNLAQAFVLEAARIDSPVTGVTALAPKGGHTLKRRGGSSLSV